MCGIAGIIRFGDAPVDLDKLRGMLGKLVHRGRDSFGIAYGSARNQAERTFISAGEVALGHRRLSIIDLSMAASQPMQYDDGRLWLVFNGEIYNYLELRSELVTSGYLFKTGSDTEVVLAAYRCWGKQCVERFNGMFAFALWDEAAQVLFCARDHFGIKPFYYYRSESLLAFASESKALSMFHGNALDAQSIAAYLLGSYVPGSSSIFQGVRKLLPGHTMSVKPSGETVVSRYWRMSRYADQADDRPARQKLKENLEHAVKRQLRSDVPVGALLSGGVDSGMVVALASRMTQAMDTYSVGFEGHAVNELPAAAYVAKRFGTRHHEMLVDNTSAMAYLDIALSHLTEPIADTAIIPSYLLSRMASEDGVKVLLSGTGGDEVFGGYGRYVGSSLKRRVFTKLPAFFRQAIGRLLPTDSKLGARFSNTSLDMLFVTGGNFELCQDMLGSSTAMSGLLAQMADALRVPDALAVPLLYQQMLFDLYFYLPDEILLLFDQMSMANTIEGRVPLIDVDVVQTAYRFPPRSHVCGSRTKVLFREIAEEQLGHEHVWRKKSGFSGPVAWWVNKNRGQFVDAVKSIADIPGLGPFAAVCQSRWARSAEIGESSAQALFLLYCLRRWYDHTLGNA